MENTGGRNAAIIILILLIIFTCTGIAFYKYKYTTPEVTTKEITYFDFNLKVTSNHGQVNNATYEISEGGVIVQEGTIKTGRMEQYKKAKNNTNYTVTIIDSEHYTQKKVCNSLINCEIKLERIGSITHTYMKNPTFNTIFLNVVNGSLHTPILCLAWEMNVFTSRIKGLKMMDPPVRLENFVDSCHKINNLTTGYHTYEITYELEPGSSNELIEVWIIDSCKGEWNEGCAEDYTFNMKTN